jgi:hypothetical protein
VPVLSSKMLKGDFLDPYGIETGQRTTFNQFPKRLGHYGHLKASRDQVKIGWGIHFEEDWHWPTIYFLFIFWSRLALYSVLPGQFSRMTFREGSLLEDLHLLWEVSCLVF